MYLSKVSITNFKSIKNSGEIIFSDRLFVLAWQNESGKSSIFEALIAYEEEKFDKDTLNFEELTQNNNNIQEVSCTYSLDPNEEESFVIDIVREIEDECKLEEWTIDSKKINNVKSFTITKNFDHTKWQLLIKVDDIFLWKIKWAVKKVAVEQIINGQTSTKESPILLIDEKKSIEITECIFRNTPKMLLFNDFSDILPDKILIKDLQDKNTTAQGYKAVLNIEKIIKTSFVEMNKLQNAHRSSTVWKKVHELSVTFQKDRNQRIFWNNQVTLKFEFYNDSKPWVVGVIPTILFYVETKDWELLEPRKRSKGMIRFLSTRLELKSKENDNKLIILYDEPWLYLHIKAHEDILWLFHNLVNKWHQIIYSTHSPSLIETNHLSNIWLVLNTEKTGTIVEDLTTSKIDTEYKRDALQPITQAMGFSPTADFWIFAKNNVILEWISDFWYFQAMKMLLKEEGDYKFVPGIWIKGNKISPLLSFCIGYDLKRLLIMDNGDLSEQVVQDLEESLFNWRKEEITDYLQILLGCKEVEWMFTPTDLELTGEQINVDIKNWKPNIATKKPLIARKFFQMVKDGEITDKNIDKQTLSNFRKIFDRINNQLFWKVGSKKVLLKASIEEEIQPIKKPIMKIVTKQ